MQVPSSPTPQTSTSSANMGNSVAAGLAPARLASARSGWATDGVAPPRRPWVREAEIESLQSTQQDIPGGDWIAASGRRGSYQRGNQEGASSASPQRGHPFPREERLDDGYGRAVRHDRKCPQQCQKRAHAIAAPLLTGNTRQARTRSPVLACRPTLPSHVV